MSEKHTEKKKPAGKTIIITKAKKSWTRPKEKSVQVKNPAMRDKKEAYMQVLQEIFAEFQRETYFGKTGKKPIMTLNIVTYAEENGTQKLDAIIPCHVTFTDNFMDTVTIRNEKDGKPRRMSIWRFIETAVNMDRWRVSSYQFD